VALEPSKGVDTLPSSQADRMEMEIAVPAGIALNVTASVADVECGIGM
jgi:hypothetical protein